MLKRAKMIADLQFGRGAGEALFPEGTTFQLSNTGRLRFLFAGKERIATVRANDGLLTLSMLAAQRLHSLFPPPKLRIVASDEVVPFIVKGGNLFAKHVLNVDNEVRAGEEVLVVDGQDNLLATGKAILSPEEMIQIKRGVAVLIRTATDH